MTTAALIVGFGSIGARHARVLQALGLRTAVVSRRAVEWPDCHADLEAALAAVQPGYVVIANATADHVATLDQLVRAGYRGKVLAEKPLSATPPAPAQVKTWQDQFAAIFVAYNLRFHPALAALNAALASESVISAQVYCGQDLNSWRPGRDLTQSYSASRAQGGGVLRDLSHELDYANWLFGPWEKLAALGGHLGPLPMDADDNWGVLLQTAHSPLVTLQVDYYNRPATRRIVVNTDIASYLLDLVAGTLARNGEAQAFAVERDATYRAQHEAILSGVPSAACTLKEGLAVMDMIAAIEQAGETAQWVKA